MRATDTIHGDGREPGQGSPLSSRPAWAVRSATDPASGSSRADCCSARAVMRVLLRCREDESRQPELLMCGHHFRAAQAALLAAGAAAVAL